MMGHCWNSDVMFYTSFELNRCDLLSLFELFLTNSFLICCDRLFPFVSVNVLWWFCCYRKHEVHLIRAIPSYMR